MSDRHLLHGVAEPPDWEIPVSAGSLLHLEVNKLALGTNVNSGIVKEPHFTGATANDRVHFLQRVDSQKRWNVRSADNGSTVGTKMWFERPFLLRGPISALRACKR